MSEDQKLKRPWHRLHVSSWCLLVLLIAIAAVVNLPFKYCYGVTPAAIPKILLAFQPTENIEITYGGFPFRYRTLEHREYQEISKDTWSVLAMVSDMVIAALVISFVVGVFERRRRSRRRRWQLSIADLSILTFSVCFVFGCWNLMATRYLQRQSAIWQISISNGSVATRITLPEVLSFPENPSQWQEHFHGWIIDQLWFFDRPVSAEIDDLSQEVLIALRDLPELTELTIKAPHLAIARLKVLESLPNLQRLQIDSGDIALTDECIRHVLQLKQLTHLRLRRTRLSPEVYRQLAALPHLAILDIEGSNLTDDGLKHIASNQQLCELNIALTDVTADGLCVLNGHPSLAELWLASMEASQESPAVKRVELRDLPKLESLHVPSELDELSLSNLPTLSSLPSTWEYSDWNYRDLWKSWPYGWGGRYSFPSPMSHCVNSKKLLLQDLPALGSLAIDTSVVETVAVEARSVQTLMLARNQFDALNIPPLVDRTAIEKVRSRPEYDKLISACEQLEEVRLYGLTLDANTWRHIGSMQNLTHLDVAGSNIQDSDLTRFSCLTSLNVLRLDQTSISNEGWRQLKLPPKLTVLGLSSTDITELELDGLAELVLLQIGETQLNSLRLRNLPMLEFAHSITTGGAPIRVEMVNLPKLSAIELSAHCVETLELSRLPALTHLDLSYSTIDDSMLDNLSELASLQHLSLHDTDITDVTMSRIVSMASLDRLDVENTEVSDEGLSYLSEDHPLTVLNLTGTRVTDRGLKSLNQLTSLELLYLGRNEIEGPGLEHIGELSDLKKLSLGETSVTSDSLRHISGLNDLKWLRLSNTEVDDQCFQHLNRHGFLQELYLNGTGVTDTGIASYQLPGSLSVLDISSTSISTNRASEIARQRSSLQVLR